MHHALSGPGRSRPLVPAVVLLLALFLLAVGAVAEYSSGPTSGDTPLVATSTNESIGNPTAWAWGFVNDGTINSDLRNPIFTTASAGAPGVPNQAEITAKVNTAYAAGYARLSANQAAYRAWVIPSRPDLVAIATNVKSNSISTPLKGDGVTDDTAALKALLSKVPAGAKVYFPPGRYRINGPITITKPLTMVGAPGTVFDCSGATRTVFTFKGASPTSRLSGVTVTGIVVEGPGVETTPYMFRFTYLQNAKISYVKLHNIGNGAVGLTNSVDVLVEDCVFDTVFMKGLGYGVCIGDSSQRVTVRDNFFVTKGRHGIATGSGDYIRDVTVENNYFEYMTQPAVDAHTGTVGPITVKGNVMYKCHGGVGLISGYAVVTDNVIVDDLYRGIALYNRYIDPGMSGTIVDRIERNTLINVPRGITIENAHNFVIQDNIARGTNAMGGIVFVSTTTPRTAIIKGNILEGYTSWISQQVANPYLQKSGNIIKERGSWQPANKSQREVRGLTARVLDI